MLAPQKGSMNNNYYPFMTHYRLQVLHSFDEYYYKRTSKCKSSATIWRTKDGRANSLVYSEFHVCKHAFHQGPVVQLPIKLIQDKWKFLLLFIYHLRRIFLKIKV